MKRRNIIHRHARLRSGAGPHTDKRPDIEKDDMDMNISLKEFREQQGIENNSQMMEALQDWTFDGIVPALCKEGCEVEPDGECSHGCPSILVKMGMI